MQHAQIKQKTTRPKAQSELLVRELGGIRSKCSLNEVVRITNIPQVLKLGVAERNQASSLIETNRLDFSE